MTRLLHLMLVFLWVFPVCYGQDVVPPAKSSNFFGISGNIGGGLELNTEKFTSGSVTPSNLPNVGAGILWKHYWYFSRNNGLILGGGINWNSFSREVTYTYQMNNAAQTTVNDRLGQSFRNSIFTLDIPIYFTHRFTTKKGEFNQYAGVCVQTIAGMLDQGLTVGKTDEFEQSGSTYYSDYNYTLGVNRLAPILLPSVGVSWVKPLKNGGRINYSIDYKLYLKAFSQIEARYENIFRLKGGSVITPDGPQPVESIPLDFTSDNLYVNLSGVSVGISYCFK